MHRAAADGDVDVVVGDDSGEPLGDSAELDGDVGTGGAGAGLAGGRLALGGAGGFDDALLADWRVVAGYG
ncbi:hypothetical protein CWE27_16280 [Streptomyces sp. EAG2]|nr:hypothetical protein CWE27_16280 [Streptomyces sp. EAG2]